MAGILWRFSGTIARDNADARMIGALADFFVASTTPLPVYTDAATTVLATNPVVSDGNGRWPTIFIPYGTFRERIRTSGGASISDVDNIPNPAPPGAAPTVDPNALLNTGDIFFSFKDGARDGAVRCNGRTVGSATSGASERAHADTQNLFLFLWGNLSDAACPVTAGRGASAALDWAANKVIGTPDLRSTVLGGLDTMGNAAASRFDASVSFSLGNATTTGSIAGSSACTLILGQLPVVTPAGTVSAVTPAGTISAPTFTGTGATLIATGTVSVNDSRTWQTSVAVLPAGGATAPGAGGITAAAASQVAVAVNSGTISGTFNGTGFSYMPAGTNSIPVFTGTPSAPPTFTGTPFGSGQAHNNVQRTALGTFYIKL
jgi:hypothetical protein